MGISLGMERGAARARLQSLGKLDKEERKRQEVWSIKDRRISHLLVGYDVAYVMIAHGRDPQYLDSYSVKKIEGNQK